MNLLDLFIKIGVKDEASGKIEGISSGAIAKASAMGQAMYDATKFVASKAVDAVKAIVGGAVEGYASYEQLAGGVKKLYGDASNTVMQFAQDAYKTSGMSANKYMEQATSFSAALINSLGGDTAKATRQTDVAMRAISDNVNTFGSDMDSVQMAFQGFAKQNYTMLDNLKLGYGGTKQEMERLIADANAYAAANGAAADLSIDSFSDIVTAIELIQEKQGIAGTTAKEAMSTIEGSWNSAKASWDNLLVAIGSGDGEMVSQSVTGLVDSIFGTFSEESGKREGGLVNNLLPVLQNVGNALMQQLPTIAGQLVEAFVTAINGAFGTDFQVDGISQAFSDISTKAQEAFDQICQNASGFWAGFSSTFDASSFQSTFENIQSIAGQVFDFLSENSDEIGAAFGIAADVLGTVANAITTVVDALGPFLPLIAGAVAALAGFSAIQPIIALVTGAFTTLTTVILPAMGMVQSFGGAIALVTTLLGGPIPIIAAVVGAIAAFVLTNEDAKTAIVNAWQAFVDFISGIPAWWSDVWQQVTSFATSAADKLKNGWNSLMGIASSVWNGIKATLSNAMTNARDSVVNAASNMLDGVTAKFNSVVSFVAGIPGRIAGALGNLGSRLYSAGTSIIGGFLQGIKDKADEAFNFVSGIAGRIAQLKGPLPYDRKVLIPNGEALMAGLRKGIEGGYEKIVEPYVSGLAGGIEDTASKAEKAMRKAADGIYGAAEGDVSIESNFGAKGVAGSVVKSTAVSINVEKMEVRDERDIKAIADELYRLMNRQSGGAIWNSSYSAV